MGITELKREVGMVAPERSEGELGESSRSGGAHIPTAPAVPTDSTVANPEVSDKAARRRFTATYKRRILQEADSAMSRDSMKWESQWVGPSCCRP
jgi:hypothetical protein